jgi:hypothetical protein
VKNLGPASVVELWSKRIHAREFWDVERGEPLETGGGQLYFQVSRSRVPDLLTFLRTTYPVGGPFVLRVQAIGRPGTVETLEFWSKSMGRMRTGPQNRQSGQRLTAWSPALGFPRLPDDVRSTSQAREALTKLGGLHIFLARDGRDQVFAGYTVGSSPPTSWGSWPFDNILFGANPGGYWRA